MRLGVGNEGRSLMLNEVGKRNAKEGDEMFLIVENGRIVMRKTVNSFKVLEELLGDLTFTRNLREVAERKAFEELSSRWKHLDERTSRNAFPTSSQS